MVLCISAVAFITFYPEQRRVEELPPLYLPLFYGVFSIHCRPERLIQPLSLGFIGEQEIKLARL